MKKLLLASLMESLMVTSVAICPSKSLCLEKRNDISFLRGPYNCAFFHRENKAFRVSAAFHFAHAIQQLLPAGSATSGAHWPSAECETWRRAAHTYQILD